MNPWLQKPINMENLNSQKWLVPEEDFPSRSSLPFSPASKIVIQFFKITVM